MVFRYFTDADRWAAWWGQGSTIDARPGGRVFVRYPNGVEAAGEVVAVDPPAKITFTYGYLKDAPGPGDVFANVVANELHADPAARVDAWFAVCSEPDGTAVDATLAKIAAPDVRVRDRFSCLSGAADVGEHIRASQRFMPGVRLQRDGTADHCQGTVLAKWVATGPDGKERGRGTNVFTLASDGRIEAVTGFWRPV
jgi:uncharacterized protein YndB with AHSA1/START domain